MLVFDALLILHTRTWYRSFASWTTRTAYGDKSATKYLRDVKE